MDIDGTFIEDTYAEAFGMRAARVVITAESMRWATIAAKSMTGFATSIIACGCEAGLEGPDLRTTPDGRPGIGALLFGRSAAALQDQLVARVGQCVMTAATTACYDGLPSEERVRVGAMLRFFGDGHQKSKVVATRRLWRIPVMDGEFVVEDRFGLRKGVAGGNFLILGTTPEATLKAAERAVRAIRDVPGVILPFPGGIARSGSKVGSKYKALIASTNDAYCPTLRRTVKTAMPDAAAATLEIIVNGLAQGDVERAMAVGIRAACGPGTLRISAGNYGGRLGKHLIRLRPLLAAAAS